MLEARLGMHLRLVLRHVGEHAVDRDAVSSVRICSSPGRPTMRLAATRGGSMAAVLLPFLMPNGLPVSAGLANGS